MRSLPALAAVGVVAAVVLAGVAGGLGGDGGTAKNSSTTAAPGAPVATSAGPTTTNATTTTEAPTPEGVIAAVPDAERTTLSSPIGRGMAGSEVERLQERLAELRFNPGPPDGQYGDYTIQAVWAFQKLVMGVPRDEVKETVTDEMWQEMQKSLDIQPERRASEGEATTNHTEVYLPSQVVVFFQSDEPVLIAHISSGDDAWWNETVTVDPGELGNKDGTEPKQVGYKALAHTPGGVFRYTHFREGRHESALGGMYDPAYFNYGIAIHGALTVPSAPASHGCIRINKFLGTVFQQYVAKDDQVFVWNLEGDEPEQAPNDYPWNQLDPDNPVNSTTTTSTTVASTVAPATQPPVTQAPVTQPPQTQPPQTQPPATTTTTVVAETTTTVDPNVPVG